MFTYDPNKEQLSFSPNLWNISDDTEDTTHLSNCDSCHTYEMAQLQSHCLSFF